MESQRGYIAFLLLALASVGFLMTGGLILFTQQLSSSNPVNLVVSPSSPQNTLQLETLSPEIAPGLVLAQSTSLLPIIPPVISTHPASNVCHKYLSPTPPPKGQCVKEAASPSCKYCCKGVECGTLPFYTDYGQVCGSVPWCDSKPVIYLYPTKPTVVSVNLSVPGSIIVSNPFYPSTGWSNILANPSGLFTYQGKTYQELFYESSVVPTSPPRTGIVIPIEQMQQTLQAVTTKLGLLPNEQKELLSWWVPQLRELNSPYLLLSVFPQEEKEEIDKVTIYPKPDTFIQFILYFKPLSKLEAIPPLVLPSVPPQRIGFTAVEWGGIIDAH